MKSNHLHVKLTFSLKIHPDFQSYTAGLWSSVTYLLRIWMDNEKTRNPFFSVSVQLPPSPFAEQRPSMLMKTIIVSFFKKQIPPFPRQKPKAYIFTMF